MNTNTSLLTIERLVKKFGDVTAVDGLSLEVSEGEILALLGPNGAGKTVTISIICGLLKPDSGQVTFKGNHYTRDDRYLLGICPQNLEIWPKQTCLEQLFFIGRMYDLPQEVCRKRAGELIDVLQLGDKRHKVAETLSGGLKRRLNLALALMHDPQILLLDEYEAGLDPQSRVLVRNYVLDWVRPGGRSVLFTTHNMDEADRMADRVAIIDHGRLLVTDTPEALKRSIGEGDVLEIKLTKLNNEEGEIAGKIGRIAGDCSIQEDRLVIRTLRAAEKLPNIIQALNSMGEGHGEITLRANTLEDVFISLTGRELRQ